MQNQSSVLIFQRILQLCRFAIAGVWLYQGLVPKLLGPHRDEIAMIQALGLPERFHVPAAWGAGVAEIALGLVILLKPRWIYPYVLSASCMVALLAFVAVMAPSYMAYAFNPVAPNLAVTALSLVAIVILRAWREPERGAPSGGRARAGWR